MAKRAYKLQEFVAHSAGVKCLKIGKKACKLLVTGGEDRKVNIWGIGKPTSLASLSGHTCPVESVAFDSAEALVLGGASTGAVKLWDLEETKMVRTLTGHRSNCTAVEFHPFGEFFASGSQDTNLKLWDIRKKGCIHTYKGHTAGIGTIRFTPDGRWVVSGGFDNAVKIWDLTAGKLLHDFKFHEGHIQSIDFHPHEFLLATGSADRTVKFWDLETFEPIGSTRPEATGVCAITFHPDGRTLFCGLNDSLKVYSWEPVICHDAVDVGWSKLSDICIHEGKLLGCSCYQNSVGLWVADVSLMEPFGVGFVSEQTGYLQHRFSPKEKQSFEKLKGSNSPGFHCLSPERQTIKDIYVGPPGAKPVSLQRVGSLNSSMVLVPLDSKDITSLPIQKQSPVVSPPARSTGHSMRGSFLLPTIVPRVNTDGMQSNARRESITTVRADTGMLCRSSHRRRLSETKYAVERLSMVAKSGSLCNLTRDLDSVDSKLQTNLTVKNESRESSKGKPSNSKIATEKFEKTWSQATNSCQESCDESFSCNAGISPDKLVIPGRTRYLVAKFEKGEKFKSEDHVAVKTSSMLKTKPQSSERQLTSTNDDDVIEDLMRSHDVFLSTLCSRLTKLQVMRQFWERNDLKGGISAIRKLPDHSVQADVITVLMEKMEIITLDLFLCLLPILSSLLESTMERHANISLEMLLKLVAVFGSTVRSTISAPRFVGVDLHAEHRLECCKQCSIELQKIQKLLPPLIKRGGMLEKCAHELNLVLQHP